MSGNLIKVLGITPVSQFPKCPPNHPCTQFCEIDKLYIPSPNPSIHDVLEVCVRVVICSTKEICTPIGRKLVIDGKKQIKVTFSTDDPCESVHSANFDIPFCAFIVLGDTKHEVNEVCAVVEDIAVKKLECRCLTVTSLIFVCPVFKKEHDVCSWNPPDNDKCQCDFHEPCTPKSDYLDSCKHPIPKDNCPSHCPPSLKKYHSGSKCSIYGQAGRSSADRR